MRWRLQEREVFEFKPETAELQHHIREIATADFRLGEFIALFKILGRVKANAHAGLHAPRASSALPRAGLRNFFDGKPLDSRLRIVARDSGHTRIDNVSNSRNRKRCFSNVRCQDHACLARMLENAALLIRAHTPVKRKHVKSRSIQLVRKFARQVLNIAFRWQKAKQVVAMARFQIENRITRFFNQPRIALARDVTTKPSLVSRL